MSDMCRLCVRVPQCEEEEDVVGAIGACSKLFCSLLERKELFRGKPPEEEEAMSGESVSCVNFSYCRNTRLPVLVGSETLWESEMGRRCCLLSS